MTNSHSTQARARDEAELARLAGLGGASARAAIPPTLLGLQQLDLSGRDVAAVAGVSPPTVSKWRHGRAEMPVDTGVFLSFVLASLIDDREETLVAAKGADKAWREAQGRRLAAARLCLSAQERLNAVAGIEAIRSATRRFRHWWAGHCRSRVEAAAGPDRLAS